MAKRNCNESGGENNRLAAWRGVCGNGGDISLSGESSAAWPSHHLYLCTHGINVAGNVALFSSAAYNIIGAGVAGA